MNELRFAFLTDTHIGRDEAGFSLQPPYVGQEAVLFSGLACWLKQHDVAFVLHGGDLTHNGSEQEVERAVELCGLLDMPTHLCLGNHDLAQPDSMNHWRTVGASLLSGGQDCFAVDAGPVRLVVVSHHWQPNVDFRWQEDGPQQPRLDPRQEARIDQLVGAVESDRTVIAVTHAPLNSIPAAVWVRDVPFHPPHEPYLASWRRIAERHANLRLVLCGHNHAHSYHEHGPFVSCTTTAFDEVPAQLRLVTVKPETIEVEIRALAEPLGLQAELVFERAWCVGSGDARTFVVPR